MNLQSEKTIEMNRYESPVVTIDGPSASGKSSVSRNLAKELGWSWVSTGAFYRGLAYVAEQEGLTAQNEAELLALASSPIWKVVLSEEMTHVTYKDQDVTSQIFSESVGEKASQISQIPSVRRALLDAQRNLAHGVVGLVAEGRDCGSVVFPDAVLKVYLTASQELRAKRRALEQGLDVVETEASQLARDLQDTSRKAAPLQIPEGGQVLDTNDLSLDEAVDQVLNWTKQAMAQSVKSF